MPQSIRSNAPKAATGLSEPDSVQAETAPDGPVARASRLVTLLATEGEGVGVESVAEHARGTLRILESLNVDEPTRVSALLFGLREEDFSLESIGKQFGDEVRTLVAGMRQLLRLKDLTLKDLGQSPRGRQGELETLRRMTLAMASDIRVVLLRLSSRLQTLRFHAAAKRPPAEVIARETLDILAPLANRLGLGQLKWELEDLAFRFLEPDLYHAIAAQLDERLQEREEFVRGAVERLRHALLAEGLRADVSGRPKHIRSIYNKMQSKGLSFAQVQDLRALRVLVEDVKACYAALGLVHQIWRPVTDEFDDYISRPKPNGYQSLHTVVTAEDGRPVEIQIRTRAMHQRAEFGVASHWRYKEVSMGMGGGPQATDSRGEVRTARVEWMRQLLMWQQEVGATLGGQLSTSSGHEGELVYLLTPQGRVVELPAGSTPVDFAYHVHTGLGHRCRGARVDGQMVPLNTPLRNGQTVEIIAARSSSGNDGPSRDWLNGQLGYVKSARARAKVRQWFHALDTERDMAAGREKVERALQREGRTSLAHEQLARRLTFAAPEDLFLAVAREEVGPRMLEEAIRAETHPSGVIDSGRSTVARQGAEQFDALQRVTRAPSIEKGLGESVRVAGVEFLLTQLARCCKPVPPDPITGFITRGRGVSVHRAECRNLAEIARRAPERVIRSDWGNWESRTDRVYRGASARPHVYPAEVVVVAQDRSGLLRDVSDVFARDRLNVVAVKTHSNKGSAYMQFIVEVPSLVALEKALVSILRVAGVRQCRRQG